MDNKITSREELDSITDRLTEHSPQREQQSKEEILERNVVSPEPLNMTFNDMLPDEVRKPLPGEPNDLMQKQSCGWVWCTLCSVYHKPLFRRLNSPT